MQIFDAASLRPTKLAVIGTGYVGIASTIGFAEIGNTVVGYDILADRIRDLKRGRTPYHEAGLSEALARHVQTGAVSFTDDLRVAVDGAEFIIVAVGTPTTAGGSADLSAVEAVFSSLAAFDLTALSSCCARPFRLERATGLPSNCAATRRSCIRPSFCAKVRRSRIFSTPTGS
jgi:threonine dehydrogenase-like Zn-dependent dehydrogenase